MKKILIMAMASIGCFLGMPVYHVFAEQAASAPIYQQDFETWEWAEISPDMAKELKELKAKNKDIDTTLDMQGPLYRKVPKFWTGGVPGKMVEGEKAYNGGKSIYYINNSEPKDDWSTQVGLHSPFGGLLKPDKKYRYEIALKGKGKFVILGWVSGTEKANDKTKWLGFPTLVDIPLTDEWKVYTGTFDLSGVVYDTNLYRIADKSSFGWIIGAGTSVYIDDFKVWEEEKEAVK